MYDINEEGMIFNIFLSFAEPPLWQFTISKGPELFTKLNGHIRSYKTRYEGYFFKEEWLFKCKTKMKELTIFVDFRTNFQALIEN